MDQGALTVKKKKHSLFTQIHGINTLTVIKTTVSAPLIAAAVAGTATAAAYINAKWHLAKDISDIWTAKAGEMAVKRAGKYCSIFF